LPCGTGDERLNEAQARDRLWRWTPLGFWVESAFIALIALAFVAALLAMVAYAHAQPISLTDIRVAFARIILGVAYGYAGLAEDGFRQLEIATRLSPRDYTQAANLSVEGLCHLIAGHYSEAVTAERRAVQLRPNFGTAWRTLTAAAGWPVI